MRFSPSASTICCIAPSSELGFLEPINKVILALKSVIFIDCGFIKSRCFKALTSYTNRNFSSDRVSGFVYNEIDVHHNLAGTTTVLTELSSRSLELLAPLS